MRKVLLMMAAVIMLQTFFIGGASAKYVKSSDKTISINTGLKLVIPFNTAKKSFELQEAVHKNLKTTTGLDLDYFYLWIELDGQPILAVDPIRGMY
ncbi:hypothetical protein ACFSFY_09335 [Sporosarcina siberiensis]|uniref:Uncharacterized protein n=1 Tax=Sporosarcina siberiensis TaxID=1365606 RepID=A0ABW4SFV3_9BACL